MTVVTVTLIACDRMFRLISGRFANTKGLRSNVSGVEVEWSSNFWRTDFVMGHR